MKKIVLIVSIIFAAGLLLTNIYNSVVDARSWSSNIPDSIITARDYFKNVSPANFFRVFSPINQLLALLSLILFWKTSKKVRLFLAIAFILYLLTDAFTFGYFYPRNDIIMFAPLAQSEQIRDACEQWSRMNWLRSFILLAGVSFSFLALNEYYKALSLK